MAADGDYRIGVYSFDWLDAKVHTPLSKCRVCGDQMTYHKIGCPLTVCPSCYPDEVPL